MKAMVLAAGLGERMLPLTLSLPKPAIPVLGRPLACQTMEQLARAGVANVVCNLHHMPEVLRRVLDGCNGPDLRFSEEPTILGTGGGIRNAAKWLRGDGPILISNSDFLADLDIEAALATHRASPHPATLVLTGPRSGYSVVEIDAEGRVLSLAGQPETDPTRVASRHLFTGFHIIDEEVLDLIPDRFPSNIVQDVYIPLAHEGRLGAYVHDGFWWEFGSPRLYLDGSLLLLDLARERRRRIAEHDPVRRIDDAVVAMGAGVQMADATKLEGRVALGLASHLEQGCRVRDSIVMPEAWIGPRCKLERAIIGQGVEIPAEFEVEDALVCSDPDPDAALPPGTRRVDGVLVQPLAAPTG